ncbi:hypothetical protein BDW74DRAFT_158853 [Aspergillus multicolor]|uniref:uncharacterized protein n=1 Tax=Aspergillus multicolor TaxID=41759 RepID=UPI003CCD5EB1
MARRGSCQPPRSCDAETEHGPWTTDSSEQCTPDARICHCFRKRWRAPATRGRRASVNHGCGRTLPVMFANHSNRPWFAVIRQWRDMPVLASLDSDRLAALQHPTKQMTRESKAEKMCLSNHIGRSSQVQIEDPEAGHGPAGVDPGPPSAAQNLERAHNPRAEIPLRNCAAPCDRDRDVHNHADSATHAVMISKWDVPDTVQLRVSREHITGGIDVPPRLDRWLSVPSPWQDGKLGSLWSFWVTGSLGDRVHGHRSLGSSEILLTLRILLSPFARPFRV